MQYTCILFLYRCPIRGTNTLTWRRMRPQRAVPPGPWTLRRGWWWGAACFPGSVRPYWRGSSSCSAPSSSWPSSSWPLSWQPRIPVPKQTIKSHSYRNVGISAVISSPELKAQVSFSAVSYTHLTLPTICSV